METRDLHPQEVRTKGEKGWGARSPPGARRGSLSPAQHQEAQDNQQQKSNFAARLPPRAPREHDESGRSGRLARPLQPAPRCSRAQVQGRDRAAVAMATELSTGRPGGSLAGTRPRPGEGRALCQPFFPSLCQVRASGTFGSAGRDRTSGHVVVSQWGKST